MSVAAESSQVSPEVESIKLQSDSLYLWKFFTPERHNEKNMARCDVCLTLVEVDDSDATQLKNHLMSRHSLDESNYRDKSITICNGVTRVAARRKDFGLPRKNRSHVWKFFTKKPDAENVVVCNVCHREIKQSNMSTKGLNRHLRSLHNITRDNYNDEKNICFLDYEASSDSGRKRLVQDNPMPSKRAKTNYIWNFFTKLDRLDARCSICLWDFKLNRTSQRTLKYHLESCHNIDEDNFEDHKTVNVSRASSNEVACKVIAESFMSFTQLASSETLGNVFRLAGKSLPDDPTILRKNFMQECEKANDIISDRLDSGKEDNARLSLEIEESTLCGGIRMWNVNVRTDCLSHSLGLLRLQQGITAAQALQLLDVRLSEFQIELKADIVAVTSNKIALLKEMSSDIIQHTCLSTLVTDCLRDLFSKNLKNEDGTFTGEKVPNELLTDYIRLAPKACKLIDAFKSKLPEDSELEDVSVPTLQGLSAASINAKLDRLFEVFETFLRFIDEYGFEGVTQLPIPFEKAQLDKITEFYQGLEPAKRLALCFLKDECDLVEADNAIRLVLDMLQERMTTRGADSIPRRLHDELESRYMRVRNTTLVHLMNFLKDPDFMLRKIDHFARDIRVDDVVGFAARIMQRIFPNFIDEMIEVDSSKWLQAKIHAAFCFYRNGTHMPEMLEPLNRALKGIRAVSFDTFRPFAVLQRKFAEGVDLSDELLTDAIVFMRHFYKVQELIDVDYQW